ncbi:hypothetical protein BO83DRAFT_403491 [Aspergillus eucalypticola CBS 122712]|uniref:Uncharacterized protein n=1 Tax=Aspergillus eucalypticola (strain CBS 122712 / IBT 29274) TaxID=1448314 RepID=A0A317UNE9_ASPEC|nr:uncharacterized protein BO83DRAFT_403491 [Aspergillus eucalypticola CBS 122712]PWY62939.1 hypothetical protein BO83DRAFT_403491 [Aspergillus eucalypticola CBS 122712]
MLDDSGTTAPGHHPSPTVLLLPLEQRSSRSSRTLTIHPPTQKGKDIVLGFKSGCTRSFLAVGQDSPSATTFFFSVRFESDHWRITYLCIQSSMMVVVGASGNRTSDGNGAGR